jgi:hypothetical protein
MPKKTLPIKYTSRDFNSIKEELVEYAKRYYSKTFQDFNEASFGALMLDTVAYVGDILSFYLDYQTNESFLDTASEYDNVLRLGRQFGYKFNQAQVSSGYVSMYILIPAVETGLGPDQTYMPTIRKGSRFTSSEGHTFTLNESIDFSDSKNEVIVARVDSDTGAPTYYAIKARGQVISGKLEEELVEVGEFEKFLKVDLGSSNITEIVSVHDAEGNEYYEVEHLSQNIIYRNLINRGQDKELVPSVIKTFAVARRFVTEQERSRTFLQFGHGSDSEIFDDLVVDPSQLMLKVHGKDHITDKSFDPTNLVANDKFGIAPSNTTLRVVYRVNTSENSNASVGSVNIVSSPIFDFEDRSSLDGTVLQTIIDSLEITNEDRILGDVSLPSISELKERIKGTFSTQNRAVTKQDYISIIYNMSSEFGSIKKCNVLQDKDSFKRNINIFVVSEDINGSLVEPPISLQENLKTWLNRYRMINDTIDIIPARIINFGIDFKIITDINVNKYDVLTNATKELQKAFSKTFEVGESLVITDIPKILNNVRGVVDTIDVEIFPLMGGNHSDVSYNIKEKISADGRFLHIPEDHILELKFPSQDIKGSVK